MIGDFPIQFRLYTPHIELGKQVITGLLLNIKGKLVVRNGNWLTDMSFTKPVGVL